MARASKMSAGEAADRLDRAVRDILCNLRRGKDAALPGLGSFRPAANGQVMFHRELPAGRKHE